MKTPLLALALASLSTPAAAQDGEYVPKSFEVMKKRGCETEKPDKGRRNPRVYRSNSVAGPEGPTSRDVMAKFIRCKDTTPWTTFFLLGMRDKAGKPIVPENYRDLLPVGPNTAMVQRLDKSWALYEAGKGERPLPFVPERLQAIDARGPCSDSFVRFDGVQGVLLTGPVQNGVRSYAYYHGSPEPAIIRDVPANRTVRRLGDRLYAWRNTPAGYVSQVYDLAGVPVSGAIGMVAFWQPYTSNDRYNPNAKWDTCRMGRPVAVALGPSLDRDPAKAETGNLWFPLSPSGEFAELPDGAIGVFSLAAPASNSTWVGIGPNDVDWISDQWALVYPEADGWSFSFHSGPLDQVIATAKGGRRYRNPTRVGGKGVVAAVDVRTGKWVVPAIDYYDPVGAPAADPATAIASHVATQERMRVEQVATLKREFAERDAKQRSDYLVRRQERVTQGTLCNYIAPINMTIDEIAFHADRCPQTFTANDLAVGKSKGLSVALVTKIVDAWAVKAKAEYRAQLEREESLRNPGPRPYVPGAFSSAIHAAGDRAVADIKKGSENWFDARRKAYNEEWQRKQRGY